MEPTSSFSPLLEEVPYKILKINRDGIILDHFSPKGMFFLIKEENIIGFDLKKYGPIQEVAEKIEYCFKHQRLEVLEYSIDLPNRKVTLEVQFKPKNSNEAIIIIRDISDIAAFKQEIKEKDELIKKIENTLTVFTGKAYFESLTLHLSNLFSADITFIGEVLENKIIRTISLCENGSIKENIEYNLKNAPCEELIEKELVCYTENVSKIFSKHELIVENKIQGYLGKVLFGDDNQPIGVLIVLFKRPIEEKELFQNLLDLLSGRATAELKREFSERRLKQSEEKLKLSESKFKALYNNTPGMFHSVNEKDEIIEVGDFWLEKMGYTREEVLGRKSIEFLAKEYREYAQKVALPQFFKDGYLRNVSYQFVTKKNKRIDVLLSAVIEQNGDDVSALVVLNDVTEQKKTEQLVSEREEKFRSLFEESGDAIVISDPKSHKILDVNQKVVEITGYVKKELLTKTIFDIREKKNLFRDKKEYKKFLEDGAGIYESTFLSKSKELIDIEGSVKEIEIGDRKVIQTFVRDITVKKKEEKILNLNKTILEKVAKESDIYETLNVVCEGIEDIYPDMICSVLIYNRMNNWLNYGAGPKLPKFYTKAVDKFPVGPVSCSCGTAAFTGETVIVSDIAQDPLWESAAGLAAKAKLKACWSVPMTASDGALLGTFAVYYREVKKPSANELELITNFSNLIGIALENDFNKSNLISKEKRYRQLVNSSPIGILIHTEGLIKFVNSEAIRISKAKDESQLLEMTVCKFLNADPKVSKKKNNTINQKKVQRREEKFYCLDGSYIDVEIIETTVSYQGVPSNQLVFYDITERKKAERILNLNKVILEKIARENDIYDILNFSCVGMESIYPEMICSVLIYNENKNWLNYGAGPSLPKYYTKAVDNFPVGATNCSCGTAVYKKETTIVSDIENDPLWKAKKDIAAKAKLKACWSIPMLSSKKLVLGTFAVYFREKREPKKHELELINNFSNLIGVALENDLNKRNLVSKEERHRSLNNSVLDAIIICNGFGEVVSWNKGAEKIFGFMEEEVLTKSVAVIIPDQYVNACVEGLKKIHQEGPNRRIGNIIETEGMNKKGELFPIEISTSSWLTREDRFFSAIIRDISERKVIENKQKNLNDYLIKQNKQLEDFAHIASHNLRAPIANIESLLQLQLIDDSEETVDFIFDQLNQVSKNLIETIDDITEVLKTSWELNKNKQRLKFSEMYDRIMNSISGFVKETKVEVNSDFQIANDIEYPRAYLESIMQNLMLNAVKYSDPKKKSWVKVNTELVGEALVLHVEDNGLGLDLNRHGRKLFGLRKTFHKNENARGVGLFITKAQVESMGGRIEVESCKGEGSKFSVYFNPV